MTWSSVKKRSHPPIELEIRGCSPRLWGHFKQYHYLSHEIPRTVDCYAAVYKGTPIGFIAVTHGVGKTRYFRVSRVVTIPDYQGIGVARSLLDFVGEKYSREGKLPLTMVTSNPQFIHAKLPNWGIVRIGHASPHIGARDNREIAGISHSTSARRITISMKYVPTRRTHVRRLGKCS